MKTIIAGSRTITEPRLLRELIEKSGFNITEVVSGGAKGVDAMGEQWARENKIPIKRFDPDWDKYGAGAGPERNRLMAEYAEALIVLWDGRSRGTANMIANALYERLKIAFE